MLLAHLGALLAVTMWGVSFVSTKVLLDNGMNPVEVYVYRFVIAYVLVLCFCHKRLMSHSWRDEMLFAVCGLCQYLNRSSDLILAFARAAYILLRRTRRWNIRW